MKNQLFIVLTLVTFTLFSCEEESATVNPPPSSQPNSQPNSESTSTAAVTISSFYPESAACGEEVTIFGENLGTSISHNYVSFSGAYAEVLEAQSGMVRVRVPLNLNPGDYTISLSAFGQTCTSTKAFKIK